MLVKYVRNKYGEKIGCLVALKVSDTKIGVGWSKCNKLDNFSKKKARFIASRRAEKCFIDNKNDWYYNKIILNAPDCIKEDFLVFVNRTKKYYRDVFNVTN